jgi:hypothetical protein
MGGFVKGYGTGMVTSSIIRYTAEEMDRTRNWLGKIGIAFTAAMFLTPLNAFAAGNSWGARWCEGTSPVHTMLELEFETLNQLISNATYKAFEEKEGATWYKEFFRICVSSMISAGTSIFKQAIHVQIGDYPAAWTNGDIKNFEGKISDLRKQYPGELMQVNSKTGIVRIGGAGRPVKIEMIFRDGQFEETNRTVWIVSNGLGNPNDEGTVSESAKRFRQALINQGVEIDSIYALPVYENGNFVGDLGTWMTDEFGNRYDYIIIKEMLSVLLTQTTYYDALGNKCVIANEMREKYNTLNTKDGFAFAKKVMILYSGSGNPGLVSVNEFEDMDVNYIVNYGTPTLKGIDEIYQVTNPNLKAYINLYGENDIYRSTLNAVGPKQICDVNGKNITVNLKILGAAHGDFAPEAGASEFRLRVGVFNAYVAQIASREIMFSKFLKETEGIKPIFKDNVLVEYEVDVNKIKYPE